MKSSRLQREIEDNLKRAYDDVLNQDVPDKFLNLLDQLRAQESGREQSKPSSGEAHD